MAKIRKCAVCGKEYQYCPTCGADRNKPLWMDTFDTENCKGIWDTLCELGVGHLTEAETGTRLKKYDTSDIGVERLRIKVDRLLSLAGAPVEEPAKEDAPVEEAPVETAVEPTVEPEAPAFTSKRKRHGEYKGFSSLN